MQKASLARGPVSPFARSRVGFYQARPVSSVGAAFQPRYFLVRHAGESRHPESGTSLSTSSIL